MHFCTLPIVIESIVCVKFCLIILPQAETILKERYFMINYEEEIKRFKPSLDVDQIEDAIVKVDLTDMNDIMTKLIEDAIKQKKDTQK